MSNTQQLDVGTEQASSIYPEIVLLSPGPSIGVRISLFGYEYLTKIERI